MIQMPNIYVVKRKKKIPHVKHLPRSRQVIPIYNVKNVYQVIHLIKIHQINQMANVENVQQSVNQVVLLMAQISNVQHVMMITEKLVTVNVSVNQQSKKQQIK